jgi:hypothetical protein
LFCRRYRMLDVLHHEDLRRKITLGIYHPRRRDGIMSDATE